MAKKHQRNKKGTVAIVLRGNMLNLRWTHGGKRYRLPLGMNDTPVNRYLAQGKASDIQADIAYGRFDATLAKYRGQSQESSTAVSTVELFKQFMEHQKQEGTSGQSLSSRYKPLLSNLQRFEQSIEDVDTAREFVEVLRSRQSPRIANQNLSLLKSFGRWCVQAGHIVENPFTPLKPIKGGKRVKTAKPLTIEEVRRFLETIREDQTYAYFHDFCYVLFALGLRPSEAIGLRWKHLDLSRAEVMICESLSRSPDGKSAGYARERKTTKTENSRVLPLSERLVAMFNSRYSPKVKSDDLVFTSKTGKPIDDRNFRERVWKRTCEKAGIEYRSPYIARHTLLSHGIEMEGWSLPQAARIAGHSSTRMVLETYGHMIDRPNLPDF